MKAAKAPSYTFSEFGITFVDSNGNGIADKGDKIFVGKSKKAVLLDVAGKRDCPEIASLKRSLFGDPKISLGGLHYAKADLFLQQRDKAETLQKKLGSGESLDAAEVAKGALSCARKAELMADQLFGDGPGAQDDGEVAAKKTLHYLPDEILRAAGERIEKEGDVVSAKALGFKDSDLAGVIEKRAELLIKDIRRTAAEKGSREAKREFHAALKELKDAGASRVLIKRFKSEFRDIDEVEGPFTQEVATPANPDLPDGTHFLSVVRKTYSSKHADSAAMACAEIKTTFGPEKMEASSAKAVERARSEYETLRKGYAGVRKEWERLKAQCADLTPEERKKYEGDLQELQDAFAYYQQDIEAAYLSAFVAAKDHNMYFPHSKMDLPAEKPELAEAKL